MLNHMYSFRAVARLLEYPDATLREACEDVMADLASAEQFPEALQQAINNFVDALMHADLLEAQASYVDTFEYGRSTSLLLFEHVYGESRERGQAMVDLQETYRQAGLNLQARELPDYLPLFLEYLSTLPETAAKARLGQFAPVLSRLSERLRQRENAYAVLFEALLTLCGKQDIKTIPENETLPDNTPAAIDAVWEETQVRFGAPQQCDAQVTRNVQQPIFWGRENGVLHSPVKH